MPRQLRPVSDLPLSNEAFPVESGDAPILEASGLGKRFDVYPHDRSRFFEFLGSRSHHREHWAIRGFDLDLRRGQSIGVLGNNGAGKSTLLRLLAGITEPTEGHVQTRGRLSALLDLGVGFQEGFTGRENLELSCVLLGLSPEEIEARVPEIIRFAELGSAIDDPVRTYSSGMSLRLGFSAAVHVAAEVLLVDEVLAVGDQYFQRKCVNKIQSLLAEGVALVLVSHDLHAIRALCREAIWIDGGSVRMRGPARQVVESYLDLDRVREAQGRPAPAVAPPPRQAPRNVPLPPAVVVESDPQLQEAVLRASTLPDAAALFTEPAGTAPRVEDARGLLVSGTGEVRVLRVQLLDRNGVERASIQTGQSLVVAVTFRTTEPVQDAIFGVALFRNDGTYVYGPNTGFDQVLKGRWNGVYTVFVHYPELPLLAGQLRLSVAIYDSGHVRPMAWHNQLYELTVEQDVEDHGLVRLPHRWGMIAHHEGE